MWEKEKLLVMSSFSFSHIVFIRLALQTRKNKSLFGKGLNLAKMMDVVFDRLENILEKEKTSYQKSFFHKVINSLLNDNFFTTK